MKGEEKGKEQCCIRPVSNLRLSALKVGSTPSAASYHHFLQSTVQTYTRTYKTLRYVTTPRQFERVRGNADVGTT
jgi:hypothetical protein